MAKRKGKVDYVTGAEFARRMRVTRSAITQARKEGRIDHEPGTTLYDFDKCSKALRHEFDRPEIKERLSGSDWAKKYRVLADGSASGRRWRPNLTPYAVEVLDRMTDPNEPCRVFVVEKGSQLGLSTVAENLIGYTIHYEPVPMLMTQETQKKMQATARRAIQPMLDTPLFENLVSPPGHRGRGPVNSTNEIGYPGGSLTMAGSNSSNSYSSVPAPIIILDEYARYPKDVKKEGDVLTLATGRIRTYGDQARIYVPSTPVDDAEETGSMTALHKLGDCREFFVACPHCGELDFLRPERFDYSLHPKLKAWMICEKCGGAGTKREYARHFINGVWRPTAKSKMSFLTSYRIPAFLAPLKWGGWEMIAEIYDQAKQGTLSMQGVVNLQFGRPYTPEVISLTEEMLKKHMVDFKGGVVPKGCSVVTISIDVQKKYVAWEAKAWGAGMVSWSIAADEIAGTVDSPEVQEAIRALVMRKWPTERGGDVQARLSLIDSGDQTATVYALCNQFPQPTILSNRVDVPRIGCLIPTKGHNAYDPERLVMSAKRARIGDVRYGGVYLWRLGGPIAKMDLFRSLARNPGDAHIGRVVYPATREMKWMRQLLAEKPERATNSTGKPIVKWRKKDREANESLDLHVMNAAGADILGLASWAPEQWKSAERAMKRPDKVSAGKKGMVKPKEKGNTEKAVRKSKMVKPKSKR